MGYPFPQGIADPPDVHGAADLPVFDPQGGDIAEHDHQRDRHRLGKPHPLERHHQVVHVGSPQNPKAHHHNGDQLQKRHAEHAHNHTQYRHLHIAEQGVEIGDDDVGHNHLQGPLSPVSYGDKQAIHQHEREADHLPGQKVTDKPDTDQK